MTPQTATGTASCRHVETRGLNDKESSPSVHAILSSSSSSALSCRSLHPSSSVSRTQGWYRVLLHKARHKHWHPLTECRAAKQTETSCSRPTCLALASISQFFLSCLGTNRNAIFLSLVSICLASLSRPDSISSSFALFKR
jgi:hypothetical protein